MRLLDGDEKCVGIEVDNCGESSDHAMRLVTASVARSRKKGRPAKSEPAFFSLTAKDYMPSADAEKLPSATKSLRKLPVDASIIIGAL